MIMAVAGTLMAFALPILTDLGEGTKLAAAGREIERELQSARLKAVTVNRVMRVRLNCPATGYFRTVEVLGNATDQNTNRCVPSAFPFPAPDQDLITRPNFDGPVRLVSSGATVTSQVHRVPAGRDGGGSCLQRCSGHRDDRDDHGDAQRQVENGDGQWCRQSFPRPVDGWLGAAASA